MPQSPDGTVISRRRLLSAAVGVAGASVAALVYKTVTRDPTQYNVVVLLLDDVHPSCWQKMPHLQSRPADRWVRFTNGIATLPMCRPSRATILTGRYNEALRGEIWLRHPDAESRDDSSVVGNIDIAPTICDIARSRPDVSFDGSSLLPLALDARTPWRDRLLIEYVTPGGRNAAVPGFAGWVSATEKYAELERVGAHPVAVERYDLRTDPNELSNLGASSSHAEVLDDLIGR